MIWEILISSIAFSLILLVPLGMKWEIQKKLAIPGSLSIGIVAGMVTNTMLGGFNPKLYQILILELFLIGGISISLLLWRFYRDPDRTPPEDKNAILSPADGRIIYIKTIEHGSIPFSEKKGKKFSLADFTQSDLLPTDGYLIGIAMNFLNVHVNRAPIDGRICLVRHIKGGFLSLKKKEAVIQNARALTVIENGNFKVGIVQIASRLVRKIILYLQEGHEIRRGERMGMIRFGSQVDLILPNLPSLQIEARPGEEVKAGLSVLARMAGNQGRR